MPLFEYECENCNYRFDQMVLHTSTQVNCPLCQGRVKKLMSTFSVGRSQQGPGAMPHDSPPKMCTNC